MGSISYQRDGAAGMTRVPITRGRRRVLLALLTGADNLHLRRLREASQVGEVRLCSFLDHLENAGWVVKHRRQTEGRALYCYDLTGFGRLAAQTELRLILPARATAGT
jgi:predicted ArsR family transcriptional regulator